MSAIPGGEAMRHPTPTRLRLKNGRRIVMDDSVRVESQFCRAVHPEDASVVCHVLKGSGPLGHDPKDPWPRRAIGPYEGPSPHTGYAPWPNGRSVVTWGDPHPRPPGVNGKIKKPRPQRALEAGS